MQRSDQGFPELSISQIGCGTPSDQSQSSQSNSVQEQSSTDLVSDEQTDQNSNPTSQASDPSSPIKDADAMVRSPKAKQDELSENMEDESDNESASPPFPFLPSFRPTFGMHIEETRAQCIHDLGNVWKCVCATESEPLHPVQLCHKIGDVLPNYVPEKLIFDLLNCIHVHGEDIHLVQEKQSGFDLAYYLINSSNYFVQCCLLFLLEYGYVLEPFSTPRRNDTLLYHSVQIENKFCFHTLLSYGANPNERFGYSHTTCLLKLLRRIDQKVFQESENSFFLMVIQKLLAEGVDIYYKNLNGVCTQMYETQELLQEIFKRKREENSRRDKKIRKMVGNYYKQFRFIEKRALINILTFATIGRYAKEPDVELELVLHERFIRFHSLQKQQ